MENKKGIFAAIARLGTAILARVRPDLAPVAKAGERVIDQVEKKDQSK